MIRGYSARYQDFSLTAYGDGGVAITQGDHVTFLDKQTLLTLIKLHSAASWNSLACGLAPEAEEGAWLTELTEGQAQLVRDFIAGQHTVEFFARARKEFDK